MKERLEESLTEMKSLVSEIVKGVETKVEEGLCPYTNKDNICTKLEIECQSRFYKNGIPYCRYNLKKRELSPKTQNQKNLLGF